MDILLMNKLINFQERQTNLVNNMPEDSKNTMPKIQHLNPVISLVEVPLLKEVGVAVTVVVFLKWIS